METPIDARDYLYTVSVVLLGFCSYFLKRSVGALETLQNEFHKLDKKVAVIVDRDRRKRLEDYDRENGEDDHLG